MTARVASTKTYEGRIVKLLSPQARVEMENAIAADPKSHPVVPGTSGVRKARWGRPGIGKSGGLRVIYYSVSEPNIVLFITAYAKSQQENLSNADKKKIRQIIAEFEYKDK